MCTLHLVSLGPARCHSARSFITAVTWPEPGSSWLPVTDTSPDLQSVPGLLYLIKKHPHTPTHTTLYSFCSLNMEHLLFMCTKLHKLVLISDYLTFLYLLWCSHQSRAYSPVKHAKVREGSRDWSLILGMIPQHSTSHIQRGAETYRHI